MKPGKSYGNGQIPGSPQMPLRASPLTWQPLALPQEDSKKNQSKYNPGASAVALNPTHPTVPVTLWAKPVPSWLQISLFQGAK